MPQQQIIWTALPNGFSPDGTKLKLSVFVSPRLRFDNGVASGTLQSFPDFLDWPARLQSGRVAFTIIVDDDEPHPAEIAGDLRPDSQVWQALFDKSTLVRSHKFESVNEPVSSYPASALAANISAGYSKIGKNSPYRPPNKNDMKEAFGGLARAIAPDETDLQRPLFDRLREMRAVGNVGLEKSLEDLGDNLLRHDPGISFDDKLAEAIAVAGQLGRSSSKLRAAPLIPESNSPASAYAQFAAFHRRLPASRGPVVVRAAVAADAAADMDFHRMLSAFGEYPHLLRRLGLVIDLEIAAAFVPRSSVGQLKTLRVAPTFTPAANVGETYTPVTKYIHDDQIAGNPMPFALFAAAPRRAAEPTISGRNLEIVGGLLNLRIPAPAAVNELQFDIIKFDVDGAARKVINAVDAIVLDEGRPGSPIDGPAEATAPAFRTSGLSLVRRGHAGALVAGMAQAAAHEEALRTGKRAVLFAEDLVRGYRIDVRTYPPNFRPGVDLEQPWRSLHQRIGTFTFKRSSMSNLTLANIADEGFVQPAMVQEKKAGPRSAIETNPVYIHESYCHWQGWSLSAPPPANPIDLAPDEPAAPVSPHGMAPVDVTFEPARASLPRLRFSNHYQLRVRTVDLAGNGLTVDDADFVLRKLAQHERPEPFFPLRHEELTDEVLRQEDMLYRRYEPIPAPALVLRRELTEGETIDVMVIRSNGPPTTTASYAASLGDPGYKGFNDRHVAPPKTSQMMAETHGALDGAFGAAGDPEKYYNICQRDGGTLNDNFVSNLRSGEREFLPDYVDIDPGTGAQTIIPNGVHFIKIEQPAEAVPPERESAVEDAPTHGYTVHYEARLRLPYLPDPMARGAALFGLPHVKDESLILEESTDPLSPGRLLSLRGDRQLLPQEAIDALGCVTKIGFPPAAEWPELPPFLFRLEGPAANGDKRPSWTEENGARMLTVRLAPAEVQTIWISSYPDKADVGLFGLHYWWGRLGAPQGERHFLNMAQHGALAMLTPPRKVTLVHAVQQPLMAPLQHSIPFGVTKFAGETVAYIAGEFKIHGLSTEKLDLLATWTEPDGASEIAHTFETHVFETPIHLGPDQHDINTDPVPNAQYTRGTDRIKFLPPPSKADAASKRWTARQEFGDTKHRRVTYQLVATTRFREYFPEKIAGNNKNLTRVTEFEGQIVKNSSRPPALEISSIIPAFRWDVNFELTKSKRWGGSLRVYLGRTWYATGAGEALAIVGDAIAGADPLHVSPTAATASTIRPLGPRPVTVPGPPAATVYPFAVHHDAQRGLWYGDLSFDVPNTYFPFVKLKLARFQEQSLDGLHLSPVIETGIHQLSPDRTVALAYFDIVPEHPGKRRIDIAVTGAEASAAGLPPERRSVSYSLEVSIEERDRVGIADRRDKDLGWTPSRLISAVAGDHASSPQTLWKGHVLVPTVADKELRIVIKEFEAFPPNACPQGQAWLGEPAGGPSRRLVYADVILIS